mmetsp:Transcript_40178/g.84111  ORF Transcript_40178/g.84111 Transcript_40178/m.84111 type:complete len:211 (-) Transcript_40178:851-1483(-)
MPPSISRILAPTTDESATSPSSDIPSVMIDVRPRHSSPTIFAARFIFNTASDISSSISRAVPAASSMDRWAVEPLLWDLLTNFSASIFLSDVVIDFNFSAFLPASSHNDRAFPTSVRLRTMTSLACDRAPQSVLNFPAVPLNSSTILSIKRLHPSANCLMYLLRPMAFRMLLTMLPSLTFDTTVDASLSLTALVILSMSSAYFLMIPKML